MATKPTIPGEDSQGFKRVHFFKYFLTEEDWNARHDYHLQKSRFHQRYFHGKGIRNCQQELLVTTPSPSFSLKVSPGFAMDNLGREIVVRDEEHVEIELDKFKCPTTVYIKIVYQEMASDRVRLKDGQIENKYFRETYRFIVSEKPASDNQLELARIALSASCVAVRNASDPFKPGPDEIDMRFRLGLPVNDNIDMETRLRLLRLLRERKQSFERLGGHIKLGAIAAIGQSFLIMEELLNSNVLKKQSIGSILAFFQDLDEHVLTAVAATQDQAILSRPEWSKHMENCRSFRKLLEDPTRSVAQKLSMAMLQLEKESFSYGHLVRLIGNERRVYVEGQPHLLPRAYPLGSNWDFIKVWSAEMPEVFCIDDMEWLKIGELNVTEEASEKYYKFRICESRDAWKTRQRLYFPDGSLVEDTGVAQEGGYSEFIIPRVIPDQHLAVIRMMDYARGDFEMMFNVNGRDAGISRCDGYDRRARWRNWPFVIPSYYVNDVSLKIRQTCLTADRDINMFRFWFYQPIDW